MGGLTYGSKTYNDIKNSLPDEAFKKKYGHLKAPQKREVSKNIPKSTGLGGDKIADAVANHKSRASMFGNNSSGVVDLKAVGKKLTSK